MKKTDKVGREVSLLYSVAALAMAFIMVLFVNSFSLIANATGQGKVTATSARIRKEASTSSEAVGSVQNGVIVTINSEVQGADSMTWYQITTSDGTTGYIRSDLMQKTEDGGNGTVTGINPTVEVTEVQPAGASITGGDNVRVRPDASTSGSFITTVSNGTAITVTGQATGTDGYVWYLVKFSANNTEIEGFVRSDFVNLSGELIPVGTETTDPSEGGDTTEAPDTTEEPVEPKLYETKQKEDGNWYLVDYTKEKAEEWDLVKLLESYQKNGEELIDARKDVKTQKIIIIILVILVIGAVLVATMLFFKIRDISDEAYFTAVERETIRERNAMKGQQGKNPPPAGRKVMQTVGTDGPKTSRPVDSRTAGKPSVQSQTAKNPSGTQRQVVPPTVNSRPAQGTSQGKPVQQGVQNRPVQPGVQGRPVQQAAQNKPVGQGNVQVKQTEQKATPGSKPATVQGRPVNAGNPAQNPNQGKQVRPTAMNKQKPMIDDDDDEFEFEFLNWDGDEK